jgi:hypothetical protein
MRNNACSHTELQENKLNVVEINVGQIKYNNPTTVDFILDCKSSTFLIFDNKIHTMTLAKGKRKGMIAHTTAVL